MTAAALEPSIPAAALAALARAPLSHGALRVALALLGAAARGERATVADLGRIAGLFERAARAALSSLLGEGGALAPWIAREWDGRIPLWRLRDGRDDGQAALPFAPVERQAALPLAPASGRPAPASCRADRHQLAAGLPGTAPPSYSPGVLSQEVLPEEPFSPSLPPQEGERDGEGENTYRVRRGTERLPAVPDDAAPTVRRLAAVLTAEGARAAAEREEAEGRPFVAADLEAWARALWALGRKLGTDDAPDLRTAGAYMLAGLTVPRRPGFDGWRAILSVAPSAALGFWARRAFAAGWGVAPSAVPRVALAGGRDPLGILAGVAVEPQPAPSSPPAPSRLAAALAPVRAAAGEEAGVFLDCIAGEESGGAWRLAVPNRLYLDWIRDHLGGAIERALGPVEWFTDPCMVAR